MTRTDVLYLSVIAVAAAGACLLVWDKGHDFPSTHPLSSENPKAGAQIEEALGPMRYEVVKTEAAQEQGLGGRVYVPHDYGMLFVFPTKDTYGFWMKDMFVPIDIIWLSDNGRIVGIEHDVQPDTYPEVFYAPEAVRYVLETRASESVRRGWEVGSVLEVPLQN